VHRALHQRLRWRQHGGRRRNRGRRGDLRHPSRRGASRPERASGRDRVRQPYPYPHPGAPGQGPLPAAYAPAAARPPSVPGDGFFSFLKLSVLRAIRLRIEPHEVLPRERAALTAAGVTEPSFQAFLAWRRSIIFVVATLLVPLIGLRALEIYGDDDSGLPATVVDTFRSLQTIPLVAEIAFCALLWLQLGKWTNWRRHRRVIAWAWVAFFVAPFVVYLYPMRSLVADQLGELPPEQAKGLAILFGLGFSLQAMFTLAPKAVSLIPGLVRAATVTKLLFPGSAAPGWLIVLGAPIYFMFIYVVLIVPYQITGSGYFVVAVVAIFVAEVLLGRGGYQLARPLTRPEAIAVVRRTRTSYFIALGLSVAFMVAALGELVAQFDWSLLNLVNVVLSFVANVWILTVVTTDVLIAALDRARGLTSGTTALADEFNHQLGVFIGQKTVAMTAVAPPPGVDAPP
jgi:hypothetical protein